MSGNNMESLLLGSHGGDDDDDDSSSSGDESDVAEPTQPPPPLQYPPPQPIPAAGLAPAAPSLLSLTACSSGSSGSGTSAAATAGRMSQSEMSQRLKSMYSPAIKSGTGSVGGQQQGVSVNSISSSSTGLSSNSNRKPPAYQYLNNHPSLQSTVHTNPSATHVVSQQQQQYFQHSQPPQVPQPLLPPPQQPQPQTQMQQYPTQPSSHPTRSNIPTTSATAAPGVVGAHRGGGGGGGNIAAAPTLSSSSSSSLSQPRTSTHSAARSSSSSSSTSGGSSSSSGTTRRHPTPQPMQPQPHPQQRQQQQQQQQQRQQQQQQLPKYRSSGVPHQQLPTNHGQQVQQQSRSFQQQQQHLQQQQQQQQQQLQQQQQQRSIATSANTHHPTAQSQSLAFTGTGTASGLPSSLSAAAAQTAAQTTTTTTTTTSQPPPNPAPIDAAAAAAAAAAVLLKKQKERFLIFTRVLVKYLEQKDPALHRQVKAVISECAERNRRHEPGYASVTSSMQTRLKEIVSDAYWTRAEAYLQHFLQARQKGGGGQNSNSSHHSHHHHHHHHNHASITASSSSSSAAAAAAAAGTGPPPPPPPPPPQGGTNRSRVGSTATATHAVAASTLSASVGNNASSLVDAAAKATHHTQLEKKRLHEASRKKIEPQQQQQKQQQQKQQQQKQQQQKQQQLNLQQKNQARGNNQPIMTHSTLNRPHQHLPMPTASAPSALSAPSASAPTASQLSQPQSSSSGSVPTLASLQRDIAKQRQAIAAQQQQQQQGSSGSIKVGGKPAVNHSVATAPPPPLPAPAPSAPSPAPAPPTQLTHKSAAAPTSSYPLSKSPSPSIVGPSVAKGTKTTKPKAAGKNTGPDTEASGPPTTQRKLTPVEGRSGNTTPTTLSASVPQQPQPQPQPHPQPHPVVYREYSEMMEMVDHATIADWTTTGLVLGNKSLTHIDAEQASLLYRVRTNQSSSSSSSPENRQTKKIATAPVFPLPGWGARNLVSPRVAWARVRLPELQLRVSSEARARDDNALRLSPPVSMSSSRSSPLPLSSLSSSHVDSSTESTTTSTTTSTHSAVHGTSEWFNEEQAEQDPVLALLSEAVELYVKSVLEKTVYCGRQRLNLEGMRIWYQNQSSVIDTFTKASDGSVLNPPPPLGLVLGCDVTRQSARAAGNAALTCKRMEEALGRQVGGGVVARRRRDRRCLGEETLRNATSMSDIALRPRLAAGAATAEQESKRLFEIYGGKHTLLEPPLGRVPKKAKLEVSDFQLGAQLITRHSRRHRASTLSGSFAF